MAVQEPAADARATDRAYVGKHVRRIDAEKKVDGSVEYTDDRPFDGYYAAVARSNVPHAEVVSVDTEAAADTPGVVAVVTGRDLEAADWITPYVGPAFRDRPLLAVDKVRYVGDPVAAVVARTQEAAEAAADAVRVEYEPLPAVGTVEEATRDDAPFVHEHEDTSAVFDDLKSVKAGDRPNVAYTYRLDVGDAAAGFEDADVVVEGHYSTPMVQHTHLEPFVTVADYERETDSMRIVTGNQTPHFVKREVARILDLPTARVEVEVPQMGGSYGAKTYVRNEPLVAALSRAVEAPVKLRQSARENFDEAVRDGSETTVRTGATADGDIVAQQVEISWDSGAYADISPRKAKKAGYTATGAYAVPNVSVVSRCTYTNKPPGVAYRGFGVSQTAWAVESNVDDLADALGMDPYELRLRNVVQDGGTYNGSAIGVHGTPDCLQAVAEEADWLESTLAQPEADHLVRGRGLSMMLKATITPSTSEAIVLLDSDGSATVVTASTKVGQGVETTLAQMAAEALGVDIGRVSVNPVNTNVAPFNTSTTSSRTTFSVGNAILEAVDDVKGQLREFVAAEWDVPPDEVTVEGGTVSGPGGSLSYGEAVMTRFVGGGGTVVGTGYFTTDWAADGESYASAFWMTGATYAEVTVDVRTGRWRVDRWVNATDAGQVIDPERARGQILGAAAQGLGHAKSEEMVFEGGQQVNKSLLDYKVPVIEDLPDDTTAIAVESGDPDGPFGAKGVGESNTVTVPPAIGNAIRDATGVRVRSLPMTPEKVLRALDEQEVDG